MIRFLSLALTSALVFACSQTTTDSGEADSLAIVPADSVRLAPDGIEIAHPSSPDESLRDLDTLFNVLARQGAMTGEFIGVNVLTESFMDIRDGKPPRKLLAALVQTGEGDYEGIREGQNYARVYSVLAVFEIHEENTTLLTFAAMPEGGGERLILANTEGENLMLAEGQDAVVIHSKSSESGAGDYGFRKDAATIYVLLNDVITDVLSFTVEDYQFSSDEQTATSEQTITGIMTVESESTDGLRDITIRTSTVRTSTEEESEDDDDKESDDTGGDNQVDSEMLYKWTGSRYEPG